MKKSILLIITFFSIGLGAGANGQTIIDAETTAYRLEVDGQSSKDTDDNYFIGNFNDEGQSTAFNFLLPDSADWGGQAIDNVQLETFFQKYDDTEASNTDLALFVKTSSTSSRTGSADYIAPANGFGTTPSGWTEIQLDYLPANSGLDEFDSMTMSTTGQSNLTTFLDDYYTNNPTGGDYLVAGFAMDTNGETLNKFSFTGIYLTDDGTATGNLSSLTITPIPEPSATGLLLAALGFSLAVRRRRRG